MFDKEKLKLSDITSKTTPSVEYVTSNDIYKGLFDKYHPNLEITNKIIDFLDKKAWNYVDIFKILCGFINNI